MKQTALFSENNPIGLTQFDSATLLVNVLDLCIAIPVYIIDRDQQVLYWSLGKEELSGLRQEDVVGNLSFRGISRSADRCAVRLYPALRQSFGDCRHA